jgi:hypothetical protein
LKSVSQIKHRSRLIRLAARPGRAFPKTGYNFQATTLDDMDGGCVGNRKPPFCPVGWDYFSRGAHNDWASEALIFCVLMLAAFVLLLDGASAAAGLLWSTGGAL